MKAQDIINKLLEITGLELTEFAMQCKIIPNTLSVAIGRNKLSGDIVTKIHDRFGIRKEFLKTGKGEIREEKPTSVQKASDNKESIPDDPREVYRRMIEGETEYLVIPRTALEGKYRLVALEQITLQEKELERRDQELIRKDHQIEGLYELFKLMASGKSVTLPEVKQTKENVGG